MSPRATPIRSRWITLAVVALATALPATATAATTVDQGPTAGTKACSTYDAIETTCVLPFGEPAATNVVVTELAVGDPEPAVAVARPVEGTPGRWSISPVSMDPTRWKLRHNTGGESAIFDVRIPLRSGERLVLVDPLIALSGATRDLEPVDLFVSSATDGRVFPITPVGRVAIESDADADGFGDETQDLCRGLARQFCTAATVNVALSGPAYVPSQQPASWTWSITNASSDPQPFVVNLYAAEAIPAVTGPPGSTCSPGQPASALEAWQVRPSILVNRPSGGFAYPYLGGTTSRAGHGRFFCVLAPLAPGETASGTIGGSGGLFNGPSVQIEALVSAINSGTLVASTFRASASFEHARTGVADPGWKAYEVLQGKVSRTGRWPVSVKCGGPLKASACAVSAIAKAPRGGTVLGKATPVSAKPGTTVSFTVVFTKAGLKWLAQHRKSSVDLQITTVAPGETPAITTDRSKPALTKALNKHFDKLAAKAKKRKKR